MTRSPRYLILSLALAAALLLPGYATAEHHEGEPAEGFRLKDLRVVPSRVWLAGARSQVLKLEEVVTQPIVLTGLETSEEREVRLYLGSGSVWKEDDEPVKIVIEIEALAPEEVAESGA